MSNKRLGAICVLLFFCVLAVVPSHAQQAWASPAEFRTSYLQFVDALAARVPDSDQSAWAIAMRQKISDIRQQLNNLPDSVLQQLANSSDRQTFTTMVDRLNADNSKFQSTVSKAASFQVNAPIDPPDNSGAVSGTTCSETPTSASTIDGEKIGLYVDRGLSVVADYACETIVEILGEGTNAPACVAAAITKAVEVVLDSLIDHQEFCNGLLDGALAEATHADVSNVHSDLGAVDTHLTNVNDQISNEFTALDTHLTNVDNHVTAVDNHITNVDNHIAAEFTALDAHLVTLFNQLSNQLTESTGLLTAQLKQVMKLELEPEGLRKIVPEILTCTGSNCPNVLAQCPGSKCSWNNVGPLP